jgi:hypothetical protein
VFNNAKAEFRLRVADPTLARREWLSQQGFACAACMRIAVCERSGMVTLLLPEILTLNSFIHLSRNQSVSRRWQPSIAAPGKRLLRRLQV